MTEKKLKPPQPQSATSRLGVALFWVCMSVVAIVPLVFSTGVYRIYVLPKLTILLIGSALVVLLLGLTATRSSGSLGALRSKHVSLALLYVGASALSTLFGVSPVASFFGSFQNEMGLITRLCFLMCFLGLIAAVGYSERRLAIAAWLIAGTGLVISVYAFIQFFGWDPFVPLSGYTVPSPRGPIVRVPGSLGHSNYLGNFLLYTTPLTASLALAWRGRPQRVAVIAVCFAVAAIAFSGARGAWLGLLVGAGTLASLEIRRPRTNQAGSMRRSILRPAIASVGILVFVAVLALSPASRDVGRRARSFVEDRFTGSGRVLLWRDAIKMVPRFALIGCGPEAFFREFLAYKSFDLARRDPLTNNESSHDSYLDAAISFGLPGAIAYVALIASSFMLLIKARRRALDPKTRLIATGLVGSLAAVATHNIFIYDQIPTGLYFFVFAALALVALNVTDHHALVIRPQKSANLRLTGYAIAVLGALSLAAALWFSTSLLLADVAIKQATIYAKAQDYETLMALERRATGGLDPTGSYDFEFARALTLYADTVSTEAESSSSSAVGEQEVDSFRSTAIEAAMEHAQRSLDHTLTPNASYTLLAYLAFKKRDIEQLHTYAANAISLDPYSVSGRWLMGEALLAQADRDGAIHEAQIALQLRPASSEARSVLARASGVAELVNPRILGLVERARSLLEDGKLQKAEELLKRAIRDAGGPCPQCHRLLALTYEKAQRHEDAAAEWEAYSRETPLKRKHNLLPDQ